MKLLTLDFETYYDDEYSLRRMTPPEYILDPRFETILCTVKENDGPTQVIDGPDFGRYISEHDPKNTATVTFNSLFDNAILAWHYAWIPAHMFDAMGMARALRGHLLSSASLASVCELLSLGAKGTTIAKVKGLHRQDIIGRGLWGEFCQYGITDTERTYAIFASLIHEFPHAERRIMDLVLRCAVEPKFRIDLPLLKEHLKQVRQEKEELLRQCGVDRADLMSSARFSALLTSLGVKVDTKISPTGREVPALAKTDSFMNDLLEHGDPRIEALAAARLGHKSTIEETRCETFQKIAELPWSHYRDGNPRLIPSGGTMPVPLGYGKAHTHRLAGDWGMNLQNLPTGRSGKKSQLRNSLIAPPGHYVVTCDLGQIEARVNAWFCGANTLLDQFRLQLDPYAILAGKIFGYPIDPAVHKIERFVGKTGILGLGYGCGVDKFYDMVVKSARVFGFDLGDKFSYEIAKQAVYTYRSTHAMIPAQWYWLNTAIDVSLAQGNVAPRGPCTLMGGKILLPNDLHLHYHNLQRDPDSDEWFFTYGKYKHKLYGAKLLENIVQALARIIVMNAALRLNDRGFRFRMQAHDELVFIIHEAQLDEAKNTIHLEMVRPPSWAPDLPLTAAIGVGRSYGEAK